MQQRGNIQVLEQLCAVCVIGPRRQCDTAQGLVQVAQRLLKHHNVAGPRVQVEPHDAHVVGVGAVVDDERARLLQQVVQHEGAHEEVADEHLAHKERQVRHQQRLVFLFKVATEHRALCVRHPHANKPANRAAVHGTYSCIGSSN